MRQEEAEALVAWLEAFPADALQKRLSELIDRRKALTNEIQFLQAQLVRHRQYLQDLAEPRAAEPSLRRRPAGNIMATATVGGTTRSAAPAEPEYPPRRLAVLRLLAENALKEWKLAELRDELVRRGWIADDDKARHALQVLMLNMAKRGEVEKPSTGIYRAKVNLTEQEPEESVLFDDDG